jgi:hypothetical protein
LLRNFGEHQEERRWVIKFSIFIAILFTLVTISLIVMHFSRGSYRYITKPIFLLGLFTFIVLSTANMIMLIATLYYVVDLSKSTDTSMKTRFDIERERYVYVYIFFKLTCASSQYNLYRYWLYVKLFLILIGNWFVTLDSFGYFSSYLAEILTDVIKVFSAAVVAYLLVAKENVRVLLKNKYQGFINENDDRV